MERLVACSASKLFSCRSKSVGHNQHYPCHVLATLKGDTVSHISSHLVIPGKFSCARNTEIRPLIVLLETVNQYVFFVNVQEANF